jgi:uncharacterized protein (DUF58 family)
MKDTPQEFHYRLRGRVSGQRPGSHPGSSIGAGQEFVSHMSLYDRPDPRRLDLRASLRGLTDEWLVRVNRQRAGASVRALVDVSASMMFGSRRPKLQVVADFVEALGLSAFRVGDAVGMMAFDDAERADLFVPARVSRGMGSLMGDALRAVCAGLAQPAPPQGGSSDGLEDAASRLAGQQGLVFLVSDFHWPLERLDIALDLLAHAGVIPVVVWDPAETEPPTRNALASLRDAESGARRTLWLRPQLREEWRRGVEQRRAEIDSFFAAHAILPFYMEGAFDADALSRYFFEADL